MRHRTSGESGARRAPPDSSTPSATSARASRAGRRQVDQDVELRDDVPGVRCGRVRGRALDAPLEPAPRGVRPGLGALARFGLAGNLDLSFGTNGAIARDAEELLTLLPE